MPHPKKSAVQRGLEFADPIQGVQDAISHIVGLFGEAGGDPVTEERIAAAEAVAARIEAGGSATAAEVEELRELMTPEDFASFIEPIINAQGGIDVDATVPDGEQDDPLVPFEEESGSAGGGQEAGAFDSVKAIDAALRRMLDTTPEAGMEAEWAQGISALIRSKAQLLEENDPTRMRMDDGTIYSREDLDALDPVSRRQVEQHVNQRHRRVEQEARDVLNSFALDEYALERGSFNDEVGRMNSAFNAKSSEFRNQIARDELSLEQASLELSREFDGLSESRARSTLEIDTALASLPYGTVGGKTSFTGGDLGAGVMKLMEQAGIADPESAMALNFPGYITLDAPGTLKRNDAALDVGGPLPAVPGLTTGAMAPQPPVYGQAPQTPTLQAPVTTPNITGGQPAIQLPTNANDDPRLRDPAIQIP
jgi:hypothetical protein